uniref:Sperm-tail PG-rich repeat containing 1 n=1 Tax=Maylandia zebra TaxID=106582 RepID=A0A3P9DKC9_9CICH
MTDGRLIWKQTEETRYNKEARLHFTDRWRWSLAIDLFSHHHSNCFKIPRSSNTKYQIAMTTHQEKKGFSTQAKRFSESPGPGTYDCFTSTEVNCPSFSKRGTTGFVPSKVDRRPQRPTPGPNAYNLQSSFINKYDFNTGASRVFRLPIAVQMDGPKHITPAPNQYDVCILLLSVSSVVGTSPFLSRTTRDSFYPPKNVPSPGHYEVNSSLIQHGSKAVLSPFRSKTQRILPPADHCVPGPGAYNPHQAPTPVKKTILPRRYFLAIAAPPQTVPKDPPLPGPGHYDIGQYDRPSKQSIPTAAFASRTQRIPQKPVADKIPGPGFYNPQLLSKHSFFYNDSRVWVPV